MYLKYGDYIHAANEAAVVITREAVMNEAGVPYAYRERWDITGFLHGDSPAAIGDSVHALEAAYARQAQSAVLILADGVTESAHKLDNARSTSGVHVITPPSFPTGDGAEYSTFRSYRIALEAEFDQEAVGTQLLAFDEVLQFEGGGAKFLHLETLTGAPQKQVVHRHTVHRATQSGSAVGYRSYPSVPSPLWPSDELRDRRRIEYRAPRRRGGGAHRSFTEFEVTWSYAFESAAPLSGRPNRDFGF